MKTLTYLDCPTGISGDMCLGALVHAGVPLHYLELQLAKLGIQSEFALRAETVMRNQQAATKVYVDLKPLPDHDSHSHDSHSHDSHSHDSHGHTSHSHTSHSHDSHSHTSHSHDSHSHDSHSHDSPRGRGLLEIEALIQQAGLPKRAAEWSLAVFRQLAQAEAAVHNIPPEKVHFHEVGATDAIVDIVGTCLGLDWLKVDVLICSPLPTGGGTVRCEHGLLPVPAPAVLQMMASVQMSVYSNGINRELVTPTGCAIATALAQSFGPPPRFKLQTVGLGAGGCDLPLPNILRLWIGTIETDVLPHEVNPFAAKEISSIASSETATPETTAPDTETPDTETIIELQTQLDDISPQAIAYVFDGLFATGAVDVFTQPVMMKKSRLGTLLTVLCPLSAVADCETLLFRETTTLGIRRQQQQRSVLAREIVKVSTAYGEIAVKVARSQPGGKVLNRQPEYEDCAKMARSHNVPWQQVHQAAIAAANR